MSSLNPLNVFDRFALILSTACTTGFSLLLDTKAFRCSTIAFVSGLEYSWAETEPMSEVCERMAPLVKLLLAASTLLILSPTAAVFTPAVFARPTILFAWSNFCSSSGGLKEFGLIPQPSLLEAEQDLPLRR